MSIRAILIPCIAALSLHGCSATGDSDLEAAPAKAPELIEVEQDRSAGSIELLLPEPDRQGIVGEYLYVATLTSGMGSNPVGLDRGFSSGARLIRLRVLGGRLMVEVPNLDYRASSGEAAEEQAARDSFARSVIWAGEVQRESDRRLRVDFTSFFVRDAVGVARTLKRSGEGVWSLDADRSGIDAASVHSFPDNLELDTWLTFSGRDPGPEARKTVPVASSLTLVQHHSLIRLPDAQYRVRQHDPRSGSFGVAHLDYSTGLHEPVQRRYAVRHRLQRSTMEPLVYYVDRGAPEPIRSALVEGASWWSEAFAAAGFPGTFRVELLPEGVHPLDVRYNVIQWVHRATRGWSYGGGVVDPRTGEMVKGHVRLGSLRIRQDRLLFEALAGTQKTGSGEPDDPIELALARIRQLSAHEVGHTLGLSHNFAASTYGGRASVMDYPAPLVRPGAGGELDFSGAYAVGMGEWDVQAIGWLYAEFPPSSEEDAELDAIIEEGIARGRIYLSDADARAPGSAEPRANLWDNGTDALEYLDETLRVRAIALEKFGADNLAEGQPLGRLEAVLAPLYFHHRFALTAAVKKIGGATYAYGVGGDGNQEVRAVPADEQRAAVARIAQLLLPEPYVLSDSLLALLEPVPPGVAGGERFAGREGRLFDPSAAAETAAAMVVEGVLQRERCARLVEAHRRDPSQPALDEVLGAFSTSAFSTAPDARRLELARALRAVWVEGLIALADDPRASSGVRARVEWHLEELLHGELLRDPLESERELGRRALGRRVQRYLERIDDQPGESSEPRPAPPGSPIGAGSVHEFCSCGS